MIKLFRKTRFNLMETGKSGKYFKYAIGEIILVVIGILIALQINNWNTERIQREKENSYLINLKRDLNTQLSIIERNLKGEEFIYQSLTKAKDSFTKYKKFRAIQEDFILLAPMNDRYTFTVTSPTYTELLSTGNIDLITNENLKVEIVQYYEDLELTSQIIQKNNDYKDNVLSSKSLSIFEFVGGGELGTIYDGVQSSFKNYETPEELLSIIKTTISKPENQLALTNMVRFKRFLAENHIKRLKRAKNQTVALLNTLND